MFTIHEMLEICRESRGAINGDECAWLFQAARQIPPGGCWVAIGLGQGRSILAAGLGLPQDARLHLIYLGGPRPDRSPPLPPEDGVLIGALNRLRELRPDLGTRFVESHVPDVMRDDADGAADAIFIDAGIDFDQLRRLLEVCRPKIRPGGRLSGAGFGITRWPGITRAVVQSLPGTSAGVASIWTWTPPVPLSPDVTLPQLSVIVASTGRSSLKETLASIREQKLNPGDEILLVHDGEADGKAVATWHQAGLPGQMIILAAGPHRDWGAAARTTGQSLAQGSHLLWQDDDDVYLPGAFDVIRREIVSAPEDLFLFRLAYPSGKVLWRFPRLQCGNVSTQMFVIPRTVQLGQWGAHYTGDFDFIRSTAQANPGRTICFVDKPIVMYSR